MPLAVEPFALLHQTGRTSIINSPFTADLVTASPSSAVFRTPTCHRIVQQIRPAATNPVAAWSGRVDEQGREPLDPPEQGHAVHHDALLGGQFLSIPSGQPVTQVPTVGEPDDLGRNPESRERQPGRLNGSNEVPLPHSCSITCRRQRHGSIRDRAGVRYTQQCPRHSQALPVRATKVGGGSAAAIDP